MFERVRLSSGFVVTAPGGRAPAVRVSSVPWVRCQPIDGGNFFSFLLAFEDFWFKESHPACAQKKKKKLAEIRARAQIPPFRPESAYSGPAS